LETSFYILKKNYLIKILINWYLNTNYQKVRNYCQI
jgi:hypothetical protein